MIPNNLNPKRLAIQTFRDGEMSEILVHQGEMEVETISRANTLLEMAGISKQITPVEPSVRSDELVDAILAVIDGEIPQYYASQWAEAVGATTEVAKNQAIELAAADPEAWETKKSIWAEAYREREESFADVEDDEIVATHIQSVFGVDVGTFEQEIVEWPDGREAEALERVFSGDRHDAEIRVFTGLRTAHSAMDEAIKQIDENL